ncbi:MAG: DUF1684 domain-containing protein [Gemmatimonadales bacterium]|nr:DUF1684 domain-containing protein [Gemmatimonadales bacterium]
MSWARGWCVALVVVVYGVSPLSGQQAVATATRERTEYVAWLTAAPNSPLAAIAQQPVGAGIRLGPADSDVPLEGVGEHRAIEQGGAVSLEGPGGKRLLPRGRPVAFGRYTLSVGGPAGRSVLTVFGASPSGKAPEHYPLDPRAVFVGPLAPPSRAGTVRVLAVDGVEVEAAEAGSVTVPIGGASVRIIVRRIPTAAGEESELEIFFRDGTNGNGTYPAGRFVSLLPQGAGMYLLDFNRARNPFCAYSSAYPCPAPWRGNTIAAPIRAGERYLGGGLAAPAGLEAR